MVPSNHNDKRQRLLDSIEGVRDVIVSHVEASESNRTLAGPVVEALREAGLFGLAVPAQFGGAEADPMLHLEVIEALTYIYPSCGWSVTIDTSSTAVLAAFLPDAGLSEVFAGNQAPLTAAAFYPSGTATPTEGGYRVNGRWRFASGIRHAEWVWAGAHVAEYGTEPQPDGDSPISVTVVLPVSDVEIHDTWHTTGLRGTGSCDFSVDDVFVPQAHTFIANWGDPSPLRGGPRYKIGLPAAFALDFVAFSLGVARRALDELMEHIRRTQSKYRSSTLAERPVVHRAVAEYDLKLSAARSLAFDTYENIWQRACNAEPINAVLHAQSKAIATYMTEIAVDITTRAFRYGGIGALYPPNILELLHRDINAGAQHVLCSDAAYEQYGVELLGLNDVS